MALEKSDYLFKPYFYYVEYLKSPSTDKNNKLLQTGGSEEWTKCRQILKRGWHLDEGINMTWVSHFLPLLAQGQDGVFIHEAAKTPIETFRISGIQNQITATTKAERKIPKRKEPEKERNIFYARNSCKSLTDPTTYLQGTLQAAQLPMKDLNWYLSWCTR